MKTKTHYKGRYLSLVERDDWEFATRTNPVVAVLVAWLPDHRLVLVEQYRKPIEKPILEIPAGKIDPGEDAAVAAVRELREEVGFQDGKVEHLMDFYSSPGFCNEKLGLFLATEAVLGEQQLDEGEFIELVRVPLSKAKEMALQGELGDAKSVAGILAAADRLGL